MSRCGDQLGEAVCDAPGRHTQHSAMVGRSLVIWPNTEVIEAEARRSGPRTKGRFAKAREIAHAARPETHVGDLRLALKRVEAAASPEFKDQARQVLRVIATHQSELTSEDVLDAMEATTHDNRAMGPIMRWGVTQGLITKTDPERFVPSSHPDRHNADLRVWRSLIHQEVP